MSVELDEALAWMKRESAGYKRAAQHFGLDRAELERYGKSQRSRSNRRRRAASPKDPDPQLPPKEEVLAWMEANGAGWRKAAAHFGMSGNTVKSWQRRREEENEGPFEGEDVPDLSLQSKRDLLSYLLDVLNNRMQDCRANQLPPLVKQIRSVHAELLLVDDAERIAKGEFTDPSDMIARIVSVLEGKEHLFERDHVDRLHRVVEKALRLQVEH